MPATKLRAPAHLRRATAKWFTEVNVEFELQDHHVRLLLLCAEAWDRAEQARETLATNGLTYDDRFGAPHPRPEVAIERDSRIAFARLLRELDLDTVGTPQTARPPAITSNRRR